MQLSYSWWRRIQTQAVWLQIPCSKHPRYTAHEKSKMKQGEEDPSDSHRQLLPKVGHRVAVTLHDQSQKNKQTKKPHEA